MNYVGPAMILVGLGAAWIGARRDDVTMMFGGVALVVVGIVVSIAVALMGAA